MRRTLHGVVLALVCALMLSGCGVVIVAGESARMNRNHAPARADVPTAVRQALVSRELSRTVDVDNPAVSWVVQGAFIVVGDVAPMRLRQTAKAANSLAGEVGRYVRTSPSQPTLILVPDSQESLARWSDGDPGEAAGYAVTGTGLPPWVVLSPEMWDPDLVDDNIDSGFLDYLLAHELVHAYTDPDPQAPVWLVEGYAEMAAMDITGNDFASVESPPATVHLPKDDEFDGDTQDNSYFLASDFLLYLAADDGDAGSGKITDFYLAVVSGTGVEDAFRTHLGKPLRTSVKDWTADYAAQDFLGDDDEAA